MEKGFSLDNKVVLITGGSGSFGKEFVRMTLNRYRPKKLIIYSRDEYKQFIMQQEIMDEFPEKSGVMRYLIGDVRDKDRLRRAFNGVEYCIHAAAMKRVEVCEYNPFEAIKTNIHGAQNVIDAAIDMGVEKVIALSTDKAVSPINLYGGTKLVSDKLFISANSYSGGVGTVFSVVRYGNVAGSRGSIIPIFQDKLKSGDHELLITDFEMTRFWITLEQAVELVYKALDISLGGETYVSKIPSFKVTDLAKAFDSECVLKHMGIREGEKIHEIMITRDDAYRTYEYDDHYIIYPYINRWSKGRQLHEGGKPVKEDFEYTSGSNTQWLDTERLRTELEKMYGDNRSV